MQTHLLLIVPARDLSLAFEQSTTADFNTGGQAASRSDCTGY